MDPKTRSRIRAKIDLLAKNSNDPRLDVKPLFGSSERFRLRIGSWRVIFSEDGFILLIIKIGARGDVYG